MGVYHRGRVKRTIGQAAQPTMQSYTVPASTGGMNARDNLMQMPPTDCLYAHNLMPSEYGLRLRKGYREWANGIPDAKAINTMLPYEGQAEDASKDRLWAISEDGIFDVTLDGTTVPTQDVTFPDQSEGAGFCTYTEFTNDAGDRFLQVADSVNGLWEYTESLETWDNPSLTGPAVDNIAFVTTWKNRLWYIEENSADAWYLAPDSNSGNCTKFTFGSKFSHGGNLMGIFSWSVDGGDGVDDLLVAISRGGDCLVYKGSDPDTADFSLVGSYFIGEVPESRRLAVEYGGELFILSTYGLTSLRDLLQGVVPGDLAQSPSAKISRYIRDAVVEGKDDRNWSLHIHPSDGFLQVIAPYTNYVGAIQYCQNLLTRAWGLWQGVPVNCAETYNANYYIGDKQGSVWLYDGTLDRTTLEGTTGGPIDFDILTSFQAPNGDHPNFKRIGFIRTIGVLAGTAALNVGAVYDYQIEKVLPSPPQHPVDASAEWDTALWDISLWDFGTAGVSFPLGAAGIGRTVSIAMRGNANSRINIVGWDLTYTQGGFL